VPQSGPGVRIPGHELENYSALFRVKLAEKGATALQHRDHQHRPLRRQGQAE
jgi:hypothetical protein